MTVRGKVISEDGEPLDGASITLVNSKGQYIGEGVKADGTGKFAITSNFLSGNYLSVSYAGMETLMIDPDHYTGTAYKEIEMFPRMMDPVVVTPGTKGNNSAWLLLIVLAGVALMASKDGKRQTSTNKRNRRKVKR